MTSCCLFSNIWLELCFLSSPFVCFMIYFVPVYCNNNCHLLLSIFFPLYIKTKKKHLTTLLLKLRTPNLPTLNPPNKKHTSPKKLPTNQLLLSHKHRLETSTTNWTTETGRRPWIIDVRKMGFEVNDFIDLPFSRASRWLGFCVSQHWGCFVGLGEGEGVDGWYGFEHLEKGTKRLV